MSDLSEVVRLRERADAARREADRAEGRSAAALAKLKARGCATVEEAEAKLAELEREEREAAEKLRKSLARFERRWGGLL